MSDRRIEVSHEALIRGWPTLRKWIDQDRAGQRLHRQITDATKEWQATKDTGVLYRGVRLAQAVEWRKRNEAMLNEHERGFLDASTRRRWLLLAGITVGSLSLLLLLGAFSGYLIHTERLRANDARSATTRFGKLASQSDLSLASIAFERNDPPRALAHLARALRADSQNASAAAIACSMILYRGCMLPVGEPMKHEKAIHSATFSSDGQRVLTACEDGSARLWDGWNGKPLGEPMKHEFGVRVAGFSSDGQRFITASMDGTARLWDGFSGKPLSDPMVHEKIKSAAFSHDGQRVVTASFDGTARIWDVPAILDSHYGSGDWNPLADLAEAIGGFTLNTVGGAEWLDPLPDAFLRETLERISSALKQKSDAGVGPYEQFLKWIVADRTTRTISPFSKLTVPEWLENRIKDGEVEGLRTALFVQPDHPRFLAHLGKALAAKATAPKVDPDEARRARGEADFLTRRALALSPNNDEVQKLRAAVSEEIR